MNVLLLVGGLLFSTVIVAGQKDYDGQQDAAMPSSVSDESRADAFVVPVKGAQEEDHGKQASPSLAEERFRMLDLNKDHQLSRQEAGAEADLANIFDEVAGNKLIDQQEYTGWVQARHDHR